MKNIKNNLREVREFLGISQSQLAKKVGLQPSAIAHFEAGRRLPNITHIVKLAAALGVTTDRLIYGNKEELGKSSE